MKKYSILFFICVTCVFGKESGYIFKGKAWSSGNTKSRYDTLSGRPVEVTMCWQSDDATVVAPNGHTYNFANLREKAKGITRAQWEQYANFSFIWNDSYESDCDVKISFYNTGSSEVNGEAGYLVHDLYLNIDWMVPQNEAGWSPTNVKYSPRTWWTATNTTNEDRKQTQNGFYQELILHETSHILGFAHEHLRSPNGRVVFDDWDSRNGDTEIGGYDIFSISNYYRNTLPSNVQPVPKLSCGDVASARALYGVRTDKPNLAPNCTEAKLSGPESKNMTEGQYTQWVGDENLNTSNKASNADMEPPVTSQVNWTLTHSAEYYENISVEISPTGSLPPGFNIKFGLKNMDPGLVTCESPVVINGIKLTTIEGGDQFDFTCDENSSCQILSEVNIQLSPCNPMQTTFIPAGKGSYSSSQGFTYDECYWVGQNLFDWLGERITFGYFKNGNYECAERTGLFGKASLRFGGDRRYGAVFELPWTPEKFASFYPLKNTFITTLPSKRIQILSNGKRRAFLIDKFEVTQGSYFNVMGDLPFAFKGFASRPAENITWFDAIIYCNKRSLLEGLSPAYTYSNLQYDEYGRCIAMSNLVVNSENFGYRLPTLMEWFQAFLAKTETPFYWGDTSASKSVDYAWYNPNSSVESHPVGLKIPNGWNLYDMAGNVEEWLWEWQATPFSILMMSIGGGFHNNLDQIGLHTAFNSPSIRKSHIGFRVLRKAPTNMPAIHSLLR